MLERAHTHTPSLHLPINSSKISSFINMLAAPDNYYYLNLKKKINFQMRS